MLRGGAGEADVDAAEAASESAVAEGGDEHENNDDDDKQDDESAASVTNDDEQDNKVDGDDDDASANKAAEASGAAGDEGDGTATASTDAPPSVADDAVVDEDEGSVTTTTGEEEEGGSATSDVHEVGQVDEEGSGGVSEAPAETGFMVGTAAASAPAIDVHNDDDDGSTSSAYVDRMELADDEGGETTPGGGYEVEAVASHPTTLSESVPAPTEDISEESTLTALSEPAAAIPKDDEAAEAGSSADVETAAVSDEATPPSLEVTDDMKRVLMKELQYTQHEVDRIRPDHAKIAIRNKLFRPWEGMPPSWYRDYSPATSAQPASSTTQPSRRRRLVRQIALSTLLGGAVIQSQVATGRIDPAEILAVFVAFKDRVIAPARGSGTSRSASSRKVKPRLSTAATMGTPSSTGSKIEEDAPTAASTATSYSKASPAGTAAAARSSAVSNPAAASSSSAPLIPDPLPVNEHVNALGEPHEHSVRPGIPSRPADESDLDVTWLDKAITACERGLRSMFGGGPKSNKRP